MTEDKKEPRRDEHGALVGWSGPFLYGLSGYRGEYARLYAVDRPYKPRQPLDPKTADRLRLNWIRRQEAARKLADEFNAALLPAVAIELDP